MINQIRLARKFLHLINYSIRYIVLFTVLFGFFSLATKGQEIEDSLKVDLEPIEVTAMHSVISSSDAPAALSIVTRDLIDINSSATLSLEDISQQMPGIWVNDRQNYALGERITIRGVGWRAAFGVRGVQVVLNDIPLTVADGQTMLNIVEPSFIRRAELLRGPAAAYWGNSSGGVLYLSTKPRYEQENNFRLKTMAGSFGTQKVEGEFSIRNPDHKMTGYTSYLNTDGYRDYSAAQVLRSGVTGSINLTSNSHLQYQGAAIYMPKAQHPSALTASDAQNNPTKAVPSFVDAEAGKQIMQGQAGLSYMLQTDAGILNITGYTIYRDLTNPLPFGIITVNRLAGGLRATFDKEWDSLKLKFGVESKFQNDDREEFENIGDATRGSITVDQVEQVWNQAIFSTATYSFGKFNILSSLRFDRINFSTDANTASQSGDRTFKSVSPSLGINYRPGNQNIFANVSTSFEAPTTTELVNRPGGGNGFNPNLKPEQTVGLETGIRGDIASNTLTYDLTFYRLWIEDLLFPYQLETDGPTFYRNQGETRHTGVEAQIGWQIKQDLKISANTTVTKAEFKQAQTVDSLSLRGNKVPGIAPFRLNGKVSWSPGNFLLSLTYKHVSSYMADNLNTAKNDAYNIFDASFSFRKLFSSQGVELQPFINVNNLFDSRYNGSVTVNAFGGRYFEPAPGRSWQAGVSVNF
ncbi:TonB-dependent receptor [Fodinibius sp.]|uniref:TonB-dependent receptor family protein n=1 Tax=Fodinibius sp. TaxID=1872440 RepID=UPI002ACD37A8|nr:TonB-dependent receptor [Fodinibius sp.]MDZ7660274.1 TonB-dependent receptor [Fodinibius sp.]